jgi:hypothetical protein
MTHTPHKARKATTSSQTHNKGVRAGVEGKQAQRQYSKLEMSRWGELVDDFWNRAMLAYREKSKKRAGGAK